MSNNDNEKRMTKSVPAIAMLVCLLLTGCSGLAPRSDLQGVPPLSTPAALGRSLQTLQIVHVAFKEREAALQCVLTVDGERIGVLGLDALGQRLFSLSYDGAHPMQVQRNPMLPAQVSPERLLADLQLAYWPLAALQSAYAGSGWHVSEPLAGTRRLRHDEQLVAEVHYSVADPWTGPLWLSNFRHGYSLAVESRPYE